MHWVQTGGDLGRTRAALWDNLEQSTTSTAQLDRYPRVVSQFGPNGRSPQVVHLKAIVMNTRSRSVLRIPQHVVFLGLDSPLSAALRMGSQTPRFARGATTGAPVVELVDTLGCHPSRPCGGVGSNPIRSTTPLRFSHSSLAITTEDGT